MGNQRNNCFTKVKKIKLCEEHKVARKKINAIEQGITYQSNLKSY
jgi:hypothetical protein